MNIFVYAFICVIISFFISLTLTKKWISIARRRGIVGIDMNKYEKPRIAEFGGIAPIASIVVSIFIYIFFKTFFLKSPTHLIEILVLIITLLLASFIGFTNDLLSVKIKKDKEIANEILGKKFTRGLGGFSSMLLTLPAAIPLMIINAGQHTITLPFIGSVWLGILYPMLLIPIAIVGTTNGYNLLAGYNGLETWLGIVIFFALGLMSLVTGQLWLALIAAIIISSLAGFLVFNKYPAKVFPGDSLTFGIGSLIACFAILGNIEKFSLFIFLPFIIEGILKATSKFKAENFGIPKKDNSLEAPEKIQSLTHFAIKLLKKLKLNHKVYEKDVVLFIVLLEIIVIGIAFFVF
ncbi:MAG: glycosyl transferase family 4 [Candidatus Pacearchaeota archaeon]|nr:glycosyl transferase family 4 [Candidatus Pacearchaeota archaeon]